MNDENAQSDGERSASGASESKPTRRFELGDFATNRILFALTLLGVLLPFNAIATHYRQIGFTYTVPHSWYGLPPYQTHVHAINFLYGMEALLAVAVYLYGFNFLFGWKIFQSAGTLLYAIALLVPPIYIYITIYALFNNSLNNLNVVLYYIVNLVSDLLFGVLLLIAVVAINSRLGGKNQSSQPYAVPPPKRIEPS
jgi:hypothetical protein